MRSTDHPQDDLLIVEALYRHGHDLEDSDPDRACRAWDLAASIAAEHGLDVSDALFQVEGANVDELLEGTNEEKSLRGWKQ